MQITILGKSIFRDDLQFILLIQASKQPLGVNLCSKKHNLVPCGRAARAKRIFPMDCSYGIRGGSNELLYAQIQSNGTETRGDITFIII